MKLGELLTPEFKDAFLTLKNGRNMSIKVSYDLITTQDAIERQLKIYEDLRKVLLQRFAQKDADGNLVLSEDKSSFLLVDVDGFNREFNDLVNLEVDLPQIPLSCIQDVVLERNVLPLLIKRVVSVPD